MTVFLTVILFMVGVCVGSFVNMLVYRTEVRYGLRNIKFRKKNNSSRSFCDFCGRQLTWYENVPILSWLWLGGKSRCCQRRLPFQYPVVEFGTGILFGIYNLQFETFNLSTVINLVVLTLLVFAAVFDWKHMILPDFSTGVAVVLAIVLSPGNWVAAVGAGLFLFLLFALTKGRGMGFGDVKLAVFMGWWLGWQKVILAFYVAFIAGALVGVWLVLRKGYRRSSRIPFGPFLIGGTIFGQIWGEKILLYLYRWF